MPRPVTAVRWSGGMIVPPGRTTGSRLPGPEGFPVADSGRAKMPSPLGISEEYASQVWPEAPSTARPAL